tara:strand:+ start:216 stop:563 length:348 start_codon:yes stop_codon:yes gene_type:complete
LRRAFFYFLSLYILGCGFQNSWNSQWIKGDDGILYVQKIDKPETREPYTGDMLKEYGGRDDGLVKEEYNYQYGKLNGVQVLWYSDGLRIEKTYEDGKIISTNKVKGKPINVIEPF